MQQMSCKSTGIGMLKGKYAKKAKFLWGRCVALANYHQKSLCTHGWLEVPPWPGWGWQWACSGLDLSPQKRFIFFLRAYGPTCDWIWVCIGNGAREGVLRSPAYICLGVSPRKISCRAFGPNVYPNCRCTQKVFGAFAPNVHHLLDAALFQGSAVLLRMGRNS